MTHYSCCYVPKLDQSGRVLGVWRPAHASWGFPGGAIKPGESPERCAIRELLDQTGLHPRTLLPVYSAVGAEPDSMVHVYQMDVGQAHLPEVPSGRKVDWVTPELLTEGQTFGPFYQKFFASRSWRPKA